MEAMVRDRLSPHMESKGLLADAMFGFRPRKSAQDVLPQLHRDVIQPITMRQNGKATLALDLNGAFDNVRHSSVLAKLSTTDCGHKSFAYVKKFLSKLQPFLRIEDDEYGSYNMNTKGTPQGAVLSPLLFNIAVMQLPYKWARVEGIQHVIYADNITICSTDCYVGEMEDDLQRAAGIVESYTSNFGLQCAPSAY